ncbi:TraB/GumN family protein [Lentiprolixibacter aurantiacus]|uniref:TraB/GumN family protein n=1 Tax=Lentiprolixibacter aurantiacus TaxID=2993939 RepID=A0AAE3MK87_9FLAO|nr:TraB/GumN family protein [Lentiprolixibacter aurantiacus]MCX2718672.1 TraB/GumN family protein [Lentiprolixibacter aurantiacus]
MRLIFTCISFCLFSVLNAQERNSLLWEISGNGLGESSYLYGTMHVSKKIAFHLDDVFYEALLSSEMIALESDPGTWLETDTDRSGGQINDSYGLNPKGFYSRTFRFTAPSKHALGKYLASEDHLINNILYRTNTFNQNFEEDTYLDMFIYRAGAKYGKPVMALEDPDITNALVGRASRNAMKDKPDQWLQEKMKKQALAYLMQDAYRERNINLLDSIDRAMYTEFYRKNMLYLRNEQMAEKLDSVMHTTKVFAGIGAAHLPGDQGVIALLRKKGYTVQPLVSPATEKGKTLKETLQNKVLRPRLTRYAPKDRFFSLALPNKLYPVSLQNRATYVSPDLANGSYIVVHRIPSYQHLAAAEPLNLNHIDQLLYENIPGSIVAKKTIERGGYQGLDIHNQLKNGDHQRYQIFVTPLEILLIKMSGEGDYVARFSDAIFNSLQFRKTQSSFQTIRPVYGDFQVRMPELHHFYNPNGYGDRVAEGVEPSSGSYYFLKKATLNDLIFLEEDQFELKQIQKRFYEELKLEGQYGTVRENSLISEADIDPENGKKLYLKSVVKGGDYYLLGCITRHPEMASDYLDSFKVNNKIYPEAFEQIVDTAMHFSTRSSVEPKSFVKMQGEFAKSGKPKSYEAYTKKTLYQNKNNEAISVELKKAHDLMAFPNIDSLWKSRINFYKKQKFDLREIEERTRENGIFELDLVLTDSGSTRGIKVKNVLKGGLMYELRTVIDTSDEPSDFVTIFYENFTPLDSLVGRDVLRDKVSDFFSALRNKDSVLLKGYQYPVFGKKHVDSLIYYLSKHKFEADHKPIELHLINRLGAIEDPGVVAFFKRHYRKSFKNSNAQARILQAIASGQNDQSVQLILELLAQDLPLAANSKEIEKIFMPYQDSLTLAKKFFPELLEYSTISEYKLPIISLLASIKSAGHISSGKYRAYKRFILNDARIQLKRHLGQVNGEGNYDINRAVINRRQTAKLLEDYLILLYPYKKDKNVAGFFNLLGMVKDPQIKTTYAQLMAVNDEHGPLALIDSLAGDINSRLMMYSKLKAIEKTYLFPDEYKTQEALAEASLFEDRRFLPTYDEVVYLGEGQVEEDDRSYEVHFFKTRSTMDYEKGFKIQIVAYAGGGQDLSVKYLFKNDGYLLPDMDSDQDGINHVTEEFLLRNHKRAIAGADGNTPEYGYLGL